MIDKSDFFLNPECDDEYFGESNDILSLSKEVYEEYEPINELQGVIRG